MISEHKCRVLCVKFVSFESFLHQVVYIQSSDFFFFLSGLQKLEQRAKNCIELRGEYVE